MNPMPQRLRYSKLAACAVDVGNRPLASSLKLYKWRENEGAQGNVEEECEMNMQKENAHVEDMETLKVGNATVEHMDIHKWEHGRSKRKMKTLASTWRSTKYRKMMMHKK